MADDVRSCINCPSYVPASDSAAVIGRTTSFPVCMRYNKPLANPQDPGTALEVGLYIASQCPDYGEERPAKRSPIPSASYFTPSFEAATASTSGGSCPSCNACSNMVPAQHANDAHGVVNNVCAATGHVLFDTIRSAKDCGFARPGTPHAEWVHDMEPLDHYQPGFSFVEINRVADIKMTSLQGHPDPRTYPTDAALDAEDIADGIRAWRRVPDPRGKGEVFLPIFDPEFFDEQERSMIPVIGDAHNPELYVDYGNLLWKFAVDSWTLGETLAIQSDPGLGKTEFTYYLAWMMQVPWRRIAMHSSSEYDEIFGKSVFTPEKGTFFQAGRYTRGWTSHACIICVDEPNLPKRDSIIESLRTTTDTDGTLYVDGAYSEDAKGDDDERRLIFHKGKYVFQVWCMNPSWDIRNIGAQEIANADVDRLSPAILPYPHPDLEAAIIRSKVKALDGVEMSDADLRTMLAIAEDIRAFASEDEFSGSWGMRQQIKVARKLGYYSWEEAYRMAALNFYEPEMVDLVLGTIKTHFPSERG